MVYGALGGSMCTEGLESMKHGVADRLHLCLGKFDRYHSAFETVGFDVRYLPS